MSFDVERDYSQTGVRNAKRTGDFELTLEIVCLYCGEVRGVAKINYISNNDKALIRAKCICEKCLPISTKMLGESND